ncbi:MAG: DUF29 domain-containing protein [Coleofasciculus sp.]
MGQFSPAYETDYYAWTQQQAQFLQQQQWNCLDIVNLVEEIESLGRQERRELRNRLGVLLAHLLKWQFQPQNRSRSWLATIREQRFQVRQLLAESPSLKPYLVEAIELAYHSAVNAIAAFPDFSRSFAGSGSWGRIADDLRVSTRCLLN